VRPRRDHRGVDLIFDVLPFGRLWYGGSDAAEDAIDYAKFFSRSLDAVIRVYDQAGNVIETQEHKGDFKEWWVLGSFTDCRSRRSGDAFVTRSVPFTFSRCRNFRIPGGVSIFGNL
jgi:hypothetical protein